MLGAGFQSRHISRTSFYDLKRDINPCGLLETMHNIQHAETTASADIECVVAGGLLVQEVVQGDPMGFC